jgi:hypothetical protein
MGRALIEQVDVGIAFHSCAQLAHDSGLADPGLAGQQHDLTLAALRLAPAAEQQHNLPLAPDQRREARAVQRIEAVLGTSFAHDLPDGDRLGEALEALWAEVRQLEQATDEPPRRLADDDARRRGDRLQTRRQVRVSPLTASLSEILSLIRSPTTT